MRYYKRVGKGLESISINKIERGIQSITNGNRSGEDIGKDLEYFFNKLSELNPAMYQELFTEYCETRILKDKEIKSIHS